jgi:cell volume regulation protein A
MSEIADFGTVILIATAGFALAVLSTKLTQRVPVPAPAVFLLAAAVASDLWPALYGWVPIRTVERIAVVALIVILFQGGMDIGWRRFRVAAAPILSLGILGTFVTAGAITLVAHYALGFAWMLSGIVGAALSPTDPAVMFSVLGRCEIGGRAGTTLEGEAGVNDPAGIALMLGMIELATHAHATVLVVVREFAVEMSIGTALGAVGGATLVYLLRRLRLPSEGLYPVLALVLAAALYGATALAGGSGFLAVFLAGLILGGARLPYKREIERFQSTLASFAELVVFVALGLTVAINSLSLRTWAEGAGLMLALALVARPLAVLLTLAPARLTWRERIFITWSGLKGAVPILLAAFALLAHVDGAQRVYDLVFVVVLLSVIGQGTPVAFVAKRLRIPLHDRPSLPWQLSIRLAEEAADAHELLVQPGSRAVDNTIRELPLGEATWITVVVREGRALQPTGSLRLRAGDRLLLLSEPNDLPAVERLFLTQPMTPSTARLDC